MTINIEKLIDLPLLTYYDENIKKYILDKIATSGGGNTVFCPDGELPEKGEVGILYILPDSLKIWNDELEDYVTVGGSDEDDAGKYWGTF